MFKGKKLGLKRNLLQLGSSVSMPSQIEGKTQNEECTECIRSWIGSNLKELCATKSNI